MRLFCTEGIPAGELLELYGKCEHVAHVQKSLAADHKQNTLMEAIFESCSTTLHGSCISCWLCDMQHEVFCSVPSLL